LQSLPKDVINSEGGVIYCGENNVWAEKVEKEIICKGVNEDLKVSVVSSEHLDRKNFWFTTDKDSVVGQDVVIENAVGSRVSAKRIK